jgi:dipeptidyl aminopeptidase/acylaminoacyl peptidase
MLLLIAAGLLITAGSQPRLPAPFGPAANGAMYYHTPDGVIHALDPTTGTSTAIVSGPETYAYPVPSRDGRRILYDHAAGRESTLFVADADGSDAHALAGTYSGYSWADWSPDDRELAIVSMIDGRSSLSRVAADGSGTSVAPIDREVKIARYLPDGRLALIAAESSDDRCEREIYQTVCALFVTSGDGRDVRTILDAAAFSGLSLSPSPDGRTLLYVRWAEGDVGGLHVVDVESGQDRVVAFTNRDPAGDESNIAEFSPDGSLILFDRYHGDEEHFAIVPSVGGLVQNIGRAWDRPDGTNPEAHFSPDGRSVLAFYPTTSDGAGELWILDVTEQGDDRRLDAPLPYLPAWQRTAP